MTANPRHIVNPSPGERQTLYRDGDTTDIIRGIMYADADSARWINENAAQSLKGADARGTLENIYAMMQGRLKYRADRPGHEIIRSPAYLFGTATGDCKSYSVAIGALCRALGIPYRYRFTSGSRTKDFHHVYVVATLPGGKDVPMDAVPDMSGRYLKFGKERPFVRWLDLRPGQKVPAGVRGIGISDFWLDTLTLVGIFIIVGWLLKKFGK